MTKHRNAHTSCCCICSPQENVVKLIWPFLVCRVASHSADPETDVVNPVTLDRDVVVDPQRKVTRWKSVNETSCILPFDWQGYNSKGTHLARITARLSSNTHTYDFTWYRPISAMTVNIRPMKATYLPVTTATAHRPTPATANSSKKRALFVRLLAEVNVSSAALNTKVLGTIGTL